MGLSPKPLSSNGKLSKSEINILPICKWEGQVCIVDTDEKIDAAISRLQKEQVIGFDVETRPAFKKGISYQPSLIQLAGTDHVSIFRLKRLSKFDALAHLLSDTAVLKVGVGLTNDATHLQSIFTFQLKPFLELGEVTRKAGIESFGLRSLTARFLGFRISKQAQCSNWANKELKPFQITYAATDAWVSREIFLAMQQQGLLPASLDKPKHSPQSSC